MKTTILFLLIICNVYADRFEVKENAVYDNSTKLFWKETEGKRTLVQAINQCKQMGWRLPQVDELKSIVDYTKGYPAIATNLINIIINGNNSWYWTATARNSNNTFNWVMNFKEGYAYWINKDEEAYFLCVKVKEE